MNRAGKLGCFLFLATDSRGRFTSRVVPPGEWDIDRVLYLDPFSWRSVPQTWVDVDPGVTNDLHDLIYDHPPPPPLVDQVKQKLGLP